MNEQEMFRALLEDAKNREAYGQCGCFVHGVASYTCKNHPPDATAERPKVIYAHSAEAKALGIQGPWCQRCDALCSYGPAGCPNGCDNLPAAPVERGEPDKVREALAAIQKAHEMVSALCKGERRWTMSIPARPDDDPDLVISRALRLAGEAIALRAAPSGEAEYWCVMFGDNEDTGELFSWESDARTRAREMDAKHPDTAHVVVRLVAPSLEGVRPTAPQDGPQVTDSAMVEWMRSQSAVIACADKRGGVTLHWHPVGAGAQAAEVERRGDGWLTLRADDVRQALTAALTPQPKEGR